MIKVNIAKSICQIWYTIPQINPNLQGFPACVCMYVCVCIDIYIYIHIHTVCSRLMRV